MSASKVSNLLRHVSASIQNLKPYVPGKPIEEVVREYQLSEVVKLASNENPLGPSPLALQRVKGSLEKGLELYPDAAHQSLKAALRREHVAANVGAADSIDFMIGNGSNEIIDLAFRVFGSSPAKRATAKPNVVLHQASFIAYSIAAQIEGLEIREAPIDARTLEVDVDAMIERIDQDTRLVCLANPNNPTGLVVSAENVERLAKACAEHDAILLLDYAYYEYVSHCEPLVSGAGELIASPAELLRKYPNVLILRTFSKIYGLAGLRVGYAVGDKELIALFDKVREPFNVNTLALAAAEAALSDKAHLEATRTLNLEMRSLLHRELQQRGFRVYDSAGNFVLFSVEPVLDRFNPSNPSDSSPAQRKFSSGAEAIPVIYQAFLRRGVIVRPVLNYGLNYHLRVSTGTSPQMATFFLALDQLFPAKT